MLDPSDAPTMRSRARIGRVLRDKWKLEQLLGVGGMATVYAATHTNNGRRVAIKMLHPELSMNPEVKTRFLREGYVANKIAHPGTVSILDDDTAEDGSVFLVMELLDGQTLEALRERSGNSMPAAEILSISDRLLDVLAAAHDKGIVHRDIKPENVFLTRDGAVKVLDFGIARVREASGGKMTMTNAGAIGTPAFMPPEQARGRSEAIGAHTDIWAVGATMYTLATGLLVHDAETVNELLLAAMTNPARPVAQVAPQVPKPLGAIIDKALAYEPKDRWANARAMQTAVRAAYQELNRPPSQPPQQRPPAKPTVRLTDDEHTALSEMPNSAAQGAGMGRLGASGGIKLAAGQLAQLAQAPLGQPSTNAPAAPQAAAPQAAPAYAQQAARAAPQQQQAAAQQAAAQQAAAQQAAAQQAAAQQAAAQQAAAQQAAAQRAAAQQAAQQQQQYAQQASAQQPVAPQQAPTTQASAQSPAHPPHRPQQPSYPTPPVSVPTPPVSVSPALSAPQPRAPMASAPALLTAQPVTMSGLTPQAKKRSGVVVAVVSFVVAGGLATAALLYVLRDDPHKGKPAASASAGPAPEPSKTDVAPTTTSPPPTPTPAMSATTPAASATSPASPTGTAKPVSPVIKPKKPNDPFDKRD